MNYQQMIRQYSGVKSAAHIPALYGCGSTPGLMTYQPPSGVAQQDLALAGVGKRSSARFSKAKKKRNVRKKKKTQKKNKSDRLKKRKPNKKPKPSVRKKRKRSKSVRKVSGKTVKRVLDSLS